MNYVIFKICKEVQEKNTVGTLYPPTRLRKKTVETPSVNPAWLHPLPLTKHHPKFDENF